MAEFAIHSWDLCFAGLAFAWLAAVAFALERQWAAKRLWACLAWFALFHALDLWIQLAAQGSEAQPALRAVRVVLAIGAVAALFEFGRRGIRRWGGEARGRLFYTPLIILVAAGVLIVSWLDPSAFCVLAGLPAQIAGAVVALVAASGLWRLGRRTPTGRSVLFRHWQTPAAAALVIAAGWICMYWYAGPSQDGAKIVRRGGNGSAAQTANAGVPGDIQDNVNDEEQPDPEVRERIAMRRIRSSLPLMLVGLGFVVLLATMWAVAQRNSHG